MPSIAAKRAREVMKQSAGGGDSGGHIIHPEAIERMDLEMGKQQLLGGYGIEEIGLHLLRLGKTKREAVLQIPEQLFSSLRNQDLGRGHPDHFVEHFLGGRKLRDAELTRTQVRAGKAEDSSLLGRR